MPPELGLHRGLAEAAGSSAWQPEFRCQFLWTQYTLQLRDRILQGGPLADNLPDSPGMGNAFHGCARLVVSCSQGACTILLLSREPSGLCHARRHAPQSDKPLRPGGSAGRTAKHASVRHQVCGRIARCRMLPCRNVPDASPCKQVTAHTCAKNLVDFFVGLRCTASCRTRLTRRAREASVNNFALSTTRPGSLTTSLPRVDACEQCQDL